MKKLYWCVDTQNDFMNSDGSLYVPEAETIKEALKQITELAANENITVVSTADWHYDDSKELSNNPNFIDTFPPHCMANTIGADLIAETKPAKFDITFDWNSDGVLTDSEKESLNSAKNILILKDAFDCFSGNQKTEQIVQHLNPDVVYIYGVAENVCVDFAVMGLLKRGIKVKVFTNAIKGLPGLESPIEKWRMNGAEMMKFVVR